MRSRKLLAAVGVTAAFSLNAVAAQETMGSYKLVSALPRPSATQIRDSARGTVWDVIYPPGMPTGMHRDRTDFVGVEMVETSLEITTPDGKKSITQIEEGVIGTPSAILL